MASDLANRVERYSWKHVAPRDFEPGGEAANLVAEMVGALAMTPGCNPRLLPTELENAFCSLPDEISRHIEYKAWKVVVDRTRLMVHDLGELLEGKKQFSTQVVKYRLGEGLLVLDQLDKLSTRLAARADEEQPAF